jgi:hypothetical protein
MQMPCQSRADPPRDAESLFFQAVLRLWSPLDAGLDRPCLPAPLASAAQAAGIG